jgi:hypothetical protein
VSEKPDVLDRAVDFSMLRLPGQPMVMHMGTSYLVNDLAAEVRKLRAANTDLLALAKRYASECAQCEGTGTIRFDEVEEHYTHCRLKSGDACPACADIRAVIAKAVGA